MEYKIIRLGLLLGNGPYAHDLAVKLKTIFPDLYRISLFPEGHCSLDRGVIDYFGDVVQFSNIINELKEAKVSHVVLAGDIGLNRIALDALQGNGVADLENYKHKVKKGGRITLTWLLRQAYNLLKVNSITPVIASEFIPELKPQKGFMVGTEQSSLMNDVYKTLEIALVEINSQLNYYVRQTVAFDGHNLIGYERESTDQLLRDVSKIKKPENVNRIIFKLCPNDEVINPTIDAPVIGVDTIHHCKTAAVDVFCIDARYGIICKSEETLLAAQNANIAIIGIDPNE